MRTALSNASRITGSSWLSCCLAALWLCASNHCALEQLLEPGTELCGMTQASAQGVDHEHPAPRHGSPPAEHEHGAPCPLPIAADTKLTPSKPELLFAALPKLASVVLPQSVEPWAAAMHSREAVDPSLLPETHRLRPEGIVFGAVSPTAPPLSLHS